MIPGTIPMGHQVSVSILGLAFRVSARLLLVAMRPFDTPNPIKSLEGIVVDNIDLSQEKFDYHCHNFFFLSTTNAKHTRTKLLSSPQGGALFIGNQNDVTRSL